MFNVEALERGIEKIKKNILVLEDAIDKERSRIKEYRGMIETIERKEKEKVLASQSIKIVRGDNNDNTDGLNN